MKLQINEVFRSIQGEGRFQGNPAVFVRVSGCTRSCSFCDTKYHAKSVDMTPQELANCIKVYNSQIIVFTGGEPLLQIKGINATMEILGYENYVYHIETNGDLLHPKKGWNISLGKFDYICCSPKTKKSINNMINTLIETEVPYDIKVVTDMYRVNKGLVKYATMLMPLTKYKKQEDHKIRQAVWTYCEKNGLFYSARLHVEVWGTQKGR